MKNQFNKLRVLFYSVMSSSSITLESAGTVSPSL